MFVGENPKNVLIPTVHKFDTVNINLNAYKYTYVLH